MSKHNSHYKNNNEENTQKSKNDSSSDKGKLIASLGIIAAYAAENLTSKATNAVSQTISQKVEKKKKQFGLQIASYGLVLIGALLLAYGLIDLTLTYFGVERVNIITGIIFILVGCLLMELHRKNK